MPPKPKLVIQQFNNVLEVESFGPQGPPGPQGSSSGFYFSQPITVPTSSFTVTHNLGKYPNVSFIDNAGNVQIADVTQVDTNNVALVFPVPVTGTVVCS